LIFFILQVDGRISSTQAGCCVVRGSSAGRRTKLLVPKLRLKNGTFVLILLSKVTHSIIYNILLMIVFLELLYDPPMEGEMRREVLGE